MVRTHNAQVRVRYAETDQMGVVYYANYFVWMEVARMELCRSLGLSYADMEREDGVLLAVVEARCRYHYPARYDQEVVIRTWIEEATTRIVRFGYEMRSAADDRKLATGETKHVFCGSSMRPSRLPEKYFKLFGVKQER